MKESLITLRNAISRTSYTYAIKPLLFLKDPEKTHDMAIKIGSFLGAYKLTRTFVAFLLHYKNKKLEQNLFGITFSNPVGLAGGFDKNAQLTNILPAIGFGHAEIGSITGEPCTGNPKPRLWRLKKSKALVINYGLKNDGCEKIAKKLSGKKFEIPIGTNIAKTNCAKTVDTQQGIADYVKAYKQFSDIGAYNTINISCPNAFGGQPFTDAHKLNLLLTEINNIKTTKPNFLKLSPDLTTKELDAIITVAQKHTITGFICSNLTKKRTKQIKEKNVPEQGGISGKIVQKKALNQVKYLYEKTKGQYIIIGCGGISTAQEAYKMIKSGASLLQLITGMIFEGPQVISEINQGLVKLLEKDSYKNISEAIGKNANF